MSIYTFCNTPTLEKQKTKNLLIKYPSPAVTLYRKTSQKSVSITFILDIFYNQAFSLEVLFSESPVNIKAAHSSGRFSGPIVFDSSF